MSIMDSIPRSARAGVKDVGRWIGWIEDEPTPADILKGVAAGLVGGFVASLVLDGMQKVMSEPGQRKQAGARSAAARSSGAAFTPEAIGAASAKQGGRARPSANQKATAQQRQQARAGGADAGKPPDEENEPPERVASILTEKVLHRQLGPEGRAIGGAAVHLGFGTVVGGLYGGLSEISPVFSAGLGTAYGTAVWALADETALPLLGLDKPPHRKPLSQHLNMFIAHLVYGSVLDLVRRGVRTLV
jgi:putative membrane protein